MEEIKKVHVMLHRKKRFPIAYIDVKMRKNTTFRSVKKRRK